MSDVDVFVSMILFALATSITPGPVNVLSAMSGARFGTLRSAPYVFGATVGFVSILLLLGYGFQLLADVVQRCSVVIGALGGGYMLWLAWRIAGASSEVLIADDVRRSCPGIIEGLLTQVVNPKAWMVALSAVSVHVIPHAEPLHRLLVFSGLFFVVCFLSLMSWAVLGDLLKRFEFNMKSFNRVMALLLVMSVIAMLADMA